MENTKNTAQKKQYFATLWRGLHRENKKHEKTKKQNNPKNPKNPKL